MKTIFLTYAKYNRDADASLVSILKGLSLEEREKDRGSYYGSLSGLVRHLLGGMLYLQSLCKSAVSHNPNALKVLSAIEGIEVPKDKLTEAQWNKVIADLDRVHNAFVDLIPALEDADFQASVKVPWFGGKPDAVPLYFILQAIVVHGTHHRGQASQILDEQKIANDYSGIKAACLP
jgi:uncharacterized damage-inducible protein DinB